MKSLLTASIFAGALALAGTSASAGETPQADPQPTTKKVCKRVRSTGSRIRQKVCHTEREWDRIAQESKETMEKNRNSRNVNVSGGDS